MPIVLRSYQNELKREIYDAWNSGHRNLLAVLPTGMGKCLGKNTPVLMFDGSIKVVQDIVRGDLLMGQNSEPRKVLSTCRGRSNLFKIVPVKGASWICNDVHMLALVHTQTGETIDIPLDRYLKESKTFKHQMKQFRVGVNFSTRPVPFDPYLLGVYLAEGSHGNAHLTTPEPEVIKFLSVWCKQNDMKMSIRKGSGCKEIGFSENVQRWHKNKIKKLAASCTKRNDRWIPRGFLINSRKVRLSVLAGLLDGDGYLGQGVFEIITKYPSLNRDVLFLARSLGFSAYSSKKIATIKSTGFTGEYFRIVISGHINEIPIKVKRKKPKPRRQIKDVLRTGFTVKPIGRGDYFGFELDGDGRFLLGDFTVTHNTKTFCVIASEMLAERQFPTAMIVHRKELVQQISLTLAEEGIQHNIIAPKPVVMGIVAAQRRVLGRQFYNYSAPITVVSVDTLNARIDRHRKWAESIKLWITDEAAHLLAHNKWGEAVANFPNALGLGVTATPRRLDKRGLGRHADGVFDHMVMGPSTRWGIDNGHLCSYKIAIPTSDYRNYLKKAGSNSDFSKEAMVTASSKSHIVGDVVANYQKFAAGKQAILFATDINTAGIMEDKFKAAGIKAKSLSSLNDDKTRLDSMLDFASKKIQVLLNVDLFDEGLDVPGIECVIHARPTMSVSKYCQMNGRGLRPAPGKSHLIIIDHVGNVTEHGLPDAHRRWTLDRIVKRQDKTNFIRVCSNIECNSPYDRTLSECPWCGTEAVSAGGSGGGGKIPPRMVDGDLHLLDAETLREMEEAAELDDPGKVAMRVGHVAGAAAGKKAAKNQQERIETQGELVKEIALWAGKMRHHGYTDRQIHKRFFLEHDQTISQALAEPRNEMQTLIDELREIV